MPRGVYPRTEFNRPHRATHVKVEIPRCAESWWAVPGLTREEFDRKAKERVNDMRKRGVKLAVEQMAW